MRVSTKGRLAVNALIDLALHAPAGPVALASIRKAALRRSAIWQADGIRWL